MAVNLAKLAFMSWLATEEMERQKQIVQLRAYYDGDQDTYLTDRLKEFLNADDQNAFNLNVCRSVVAVVEERLIITGMGSNEQEVSRPVGEWADALWEANGCDILHSHMHEQALRDGEAFVLVDWDAAAGRPRLTPHARYTDAQVDGDNFGAKAHYEDGDTNRPMQYASKRWIETIDEQGGTRKRMNLYFPDRVEKYQWVGLDWAPFQDEGDASWPVPWVDGTGRPLGIPVIHFRASPDMRSEIWDAIPMQKAINKGLIDLIAAADTTAFQMLITYGWIPTSDGAPLTASASNLATLGPGRILGTTRAKTEAGTDVIEGADVGPLIELVQSYIGWLAVITSTPQSRLMFTRQIAAEGTLKEQNEGLFAKVRKRQRLFDASWRDTFDMARRLANVYGAAGLDEAVALVVQWEPVQSRDTIDERKEWEVKAGLGIPLEQIWMEMGYSPEEIKKMKQSEEYQARLKMMQLGLDVGASEG